MRRWVLSLLLAGLPLLAGCGVGGVPTRAITAQQALTNNAELLEFEPVPARQELFRDVVRTSQLEAGRTGSDLVLFPIVLNGELTAAPALDTRADLLQGSGSAAVLELDFTGRERWPEERRESLQGLSEREAAELVARSLLDAWGLESEGTILVERASGAPWAAAWVDGILRINPSFLYLVGSVGLTSAPNPLQ
jgi:hypothetical protein